MLRLLPDPLPSSLAALPVSASPLPNGWHNSDFASASPTSALTDSCERLPRSPFWRRAERMT